MRTKHLLTIVALCMSATVWAASLQAPGKFYIKNVMTDKYVILQNSMLADVTADAGTAEVINVDYTLQDNGEGIITTLNSDNGDMVATLNNIKLAFNDLLTRRQLPTDFLDEMFTLHLVVTGDDDGSVYLCVDVPQIDNWDVIKPQILEALGDNQSIYYYITHMVPGNRHYLAVDYDDSFGFRTVAGEDSKWLMIPVTSTEINQLNADADASDAMFDLQGHKITTANGIYIQNGKKHIAR